MHTPTQPHTQTNAHTRMRTRTHTTHTHTHWHTHTHMHTQHRHTHHTLLSSCIDSYTADPMFFFSSVLILFHLPLYIFSSLLPLPISFLLLFYLSLHLSIILPSVPLYKISQSLIFCSLYTLFLFFYLLFLFILYSVYTCSITSPYVFSRAR